MRAPTAEAWWTRVHELDGLDVAEALGLVPKWGRGRSSRWCLPHNDCEGAQGDGEPAVFYGSEARRLCCRKCSKSLSNLALIAAFLGVGEAVTDAVQAEAAAHGWCDPPPRVDQVALDRRRAESRQRQAQLVEERAQREARRRATAIDVGAEWHSLPRWWGEGVRTWAVEARGWPRSLAEAIPDTETALLPDRAAGTDGGGLCSLARHWDRRLLIPIRDRHGLAVSVSCRWHLPGAPADGGPKAMTLPASRIRAVLTGQVHAFGDLEYALDLVGGPAGYTLILGEGGPDYLAAVALARVHGRAIAVTACSAQLLPMVATYLRAQLRTRLGDSGRMPRVVLAPHRDVAGEAGAREAEAVLAQVAQVRVARWPEGCGDLADVVEVGLGEAQRALWG